MAWARRTIPEIHRLYSGDLFCSASSIRDLSGRSGIQFPSIESTTVVQFSGVERNFIPCPSRGPVRERLGLDLGQDI